jgi:modulator of FtsH protease HflK
VKVSNSVLKLTLPILLVLFFLTGIYTIDQDSRGVVTRFGKIVSDKVLPGLHYHFPFPIEKIYKVKTTTIYKMSIGFKIMDVMIDVKPNPEESQWLTGDTNILNIKMMIQYTISDPSNFLFSSEEPQYLLRRIAESHLTRLLGTLGVDDVLTIKRPEIQDSIKVNVQKILDAYDIGLKIIRADLMSVDPPEDVISAFQDVSNAKADREKKINEAQGYANEIIPKARGEAESIVIGAKSEKERRIAIAKGNAERFAKQLEEYTKAPQITKERLYLDFVKEVLPKVRKYILDNKTGKEPTTKLKFVQ